MRVVFVFVCPLLASRPLSRSRLFSCGGNDDNKEKFRGNFSKATKKLAKSLGPLCYFWLITRERIVSEIFCSILIVLKGFISLQTAIFEWILQDVFSRFQDSVFQDRCLKNDPCASSNPDRTSWAVLVN